MMTQITYDGSYEGWLTAIFEIYEYKMDDVVFSRENATNTPLFARIHHVLTNQKKAQRVLNGLKQRLSQESLSNLYHIFLSGIEQAEEKMYRFCRHVLDNPHNVEQDLAHPAVMEVKRAARLIKKEAHRMEAFVRFQLTKDQLYYAIIEPDCNVLPLIESHFRNRYADQRWLIYDAKRRYGLYYDLEEVQMVELTFENKTGVIKSSMEICDEREAFFQSLWKKYFTSVNISERKNMRLHLQHLPKRYWKYLPEKTFS